MRKGKGIKFQFGQEFQEAILRYIFTDEKAYKILPLFKDSYFDLLEHSVIANALLKYFKKKKRIPDKAILKETLRNLYASQKTLYSSLDETDRKRVSELIDYLYTHPVNDSDEIITKCRQFAQYVEFNDVLDTADISNFDSYNTIANNLKKSLSIGTEIDEDYGTFLISGIKDRAHRRDIAMHIHPLPFWQLNRLMNAGGVTPGSLIMLMSEAKRFKTGLMINAVKYYLRRKKRVLYIDLENGEESLTLRSEQSIMGRNQKEILSGDLDNKILKLFRKYSRIGSECLFKRMSANITTTADIQVLIDKVFLDKGIKFDIGFIDYGDLMGCISGKTEEFNRISDAFVDMKNLAVANNWECIWTASHVKNESGAQKRKATKYQQGDVAKCIDKIRHCDIILGLQENEEERDNGVIRLEVVDQRNGMREGPSFFWADIEKQQVKEWTKDEVAKYWKQVGRDSEGRLTKEIFKHKKKKSKDL